MMKIRNIVLLAAMAVMGFVAPAQDRQVRPSALGPVSSQGMVLSTQGLSSTTALLLTDMQCGLADDVLQKRYGLVYVDGRLTVSAFAVLAPGTKPSAFERYSTVVKSVMGNRATLQIPLDQLSALCSSGLCSLVDVGVMASPRLDVARVAIGAEAAYNGTGLSQRYDGSGVVVGVIDVGFQYNHPAFYTADGNELRVRRVWNQNSWMGTRPAGFDYGREYTTQADILAARYSSIDEIHGTHVAGIAAGTGGPDEVGSAYRGMAPAADMVLVATTMTSAGIYDGIEYISSYAQSQGKPCVINMSIGSHIGPHDGTSSFDQMCNALLQSRPGGLLLVGAAGNEGGDQLHLSHTFAEGDTLLTTLSFYGYSMGVGYVDMWGSGGSDFEVAYGIIDSATGNFEYAGNYRSSASSGTYNENMTDADGEATRLQLSCVPASGNSNGSPNITTYVDASRQTAQSSKVLVAVTAPAGTTVHLWGTQCSFSNCNFPMLSTGDNDYTVGEVGGVGHNMISVGAYSTKNTWTAANGQYYNMAVEFPINQLTYFSSHGPTMDGRVKPNITAPGLIVAPINRYCYREATTRNGYVVATTSNGGNTEYYAYEAGTSMASPAVAGMLALWLQRNPALSVADAMSMLRQTAVADSYTGTLPAAGSNLWGWGKASAKGGLDGTARITDLAAAGVAVGCHGLSLQVAGVGGRALRVVDMAGRTVVAGRPTAMATYALPAAGVYVVAIDGLPAAKVVAVQR